tara:strand:+ start:1199 stop:2890 length:1692 start_codon:yes stop_codon:yes gene_type:complete
MSKAPLNEKELEIATSSKDGYVANISAVNRMAHEGKSFSGNERNCVFLNRGDAKFSTVSALSGWDMPDDSRGLALMDWDSDGRVDFWASNRNAPRVRFMHNRMKDTGNWLGLKLRGSENNNRDAIGARVKVVLKSGRTLIRTLRAGEGFASQSSKRIHIGLGQATEVSSLTIVWPDGTKQAFPAPQVNQYYTIRQGSQDLKAYLSQAPNLEVKPTPKLKKQSGIRVALQIPIPAPNLRYTISGKEESMPMAKLKRPVLVCLWSQSCQDCQTELKGFVNGAQKLGEQMDVLALCIDGDPDDQKKAAVFLNEIKFPWKAGIPSVTTNKLLVSIFNRTSSMIKDLPTPSSLLISPDGKVVALYQGKQSVETLVQDAKDSTTHKGTVIRSKGNWLNQPRKINLLYIPRQLMEAGHLDDVADYIVRAHAKLLDHKEYPLMLTWVAEEYIKKGQSQHAMAFYRTALLTGHDNPLILNNIAWQLSTHKDASIRDGKLAVKWATQAAKLTNNKEPGYLDTLAAAYAEVGEFDQAQKIAKYAIFLAKQQNKNELIPGLEKAIDLYSKRQPMR